MPPPYQFHDSACRFSICFSSSSATWLAEAKKLESGEITKEEYDEWRYKYPELDTHQIWAKVCPQELFDLIDDCAKKAEKEEKKEAKRKKKK